MKYGTQEEMLRMCKSLRLCLFQYCVLLSVLNIKISVTLSCINKHDISRMKSVRRKMTGKLSLEILKISRPRPKN
jgi:hypothetical protein